MTRLITIATATAILIQPAYALAETAKPIQLLQPGDSQMTCQALATEINTLAAAEAAPKKKKGLGLGGLGKVLMAASPLGALAGNGLAGQLAAQAAGMAQQGAAEAQMNAGMEAAAAGAAPQSVASQRKARLMGFFTAKGC